MIEPRADRPHAITLGADKAYDAEDFVNELRAMNVTPHVAQNTNGRALGDRRPHDAPRRLRRQPAHPQADRGSLRLDEDGRRAGARPSSEDATGSAGPSPSRPRPTIWCGCRSSWRRRHERARRTASSSAAGGSSRPISGIAIISISAGRRRSSSTDHGRGEIAFGALQAGLDVEYGRYLDRTSPGTASTKWTKSPATALPNCSTTAPSRSNSPITMATRPSSKRNGRLLQQPAS